MTSIYIALLHILGLGRSPGEGNGNPLKFSCLENSMDRGSWQATQSIWAWKQSDTTERSTHTHSWAWPA